MKDNLIYNLGASIITFTLTVFITFWMTPFIINSLGAEAYGFIPLTQQIISILSILTIALSSVIARFFTISISQDNYNKAEGYFNTYLVSSFLGSIILFIITLIVMFLINKFINVPSHLINDVRLSILFGGLLIIATLISSLFLAGPFSVNKLYITKGIELLNAVIKAVTTLILLLLLPPKIWYVSLGAMIAGVISLLVSLYFFKKLIPLVSINIKRFEFSKLKDLLTAGAWNSVGQIGVVLFLAIEIIVANVFFGATKAGIYAALLQIPLLLRTVAGITSAVFAPIIIKHYANNDTRSLIKYSNKAVKINGLLIALPAGLICGLAGSVLEIWLGPSFENYKWLLILNTAYLIFTLSPLPLSHIFTAVNMLKVPGIATVILGILNVFLAVGLSGFTNLGLFSLVVSGAISLTLKNFVFLPLYSSVITKQSVFTYYKGIMPPVIGAAFVISFSITIDLYFQISSWADLILSGLVIAMGYIIFTFLFLVNKEERKLITSTLNRK